MHEARQSNSSRCFANGVLARFFPRSRLCGVMKNKPRHLSRAFILSLVLALGILNRASAFAPAAAIQDLAIRVIEMNLANGIANSLDGKLDTALDALADANVENDLAAFNSLNAFMNAVEAQRGKKITNAQANELIAAADHIQDLLAGGGDVDTDGDGLTDAQEAILGTNPTKPDTDFDGLRDGEELTYGTNPLDPDSDNGGQLDGYEVHGLHTNPLNGADDFSVPDPGPYSDADGLPDLVEVLIGTDPFNIDTDGDGLDDYAEVAIGFDPTVISD